jgi:hypothetical protein
MKSPSATHLIKIIFLVVALCEAMLHEASAQEDTITVKIPKTNTCNPDKSNYFPEQALRLALSKTAENKKIRIEYMSKEYYSQRLLWFLINTDQLDVLWSTTTKEREQLMLPVRYNLLRGVNEYRRILTSGEGLERLAGVKTVEDLQKFTAGVGLYWSDIEVLKENHLKYVISPTYESSFRMLAAKRFDYMLRGPQELETERQSFENLHLTSPDGVYLHYCLPVYFFVKKNNVLLADRITRGLQIAAADGSLDRLFFSVPSLKKAFIETRQLIGSEKVIQLKNSYCDTDE